MPSIANGEPWQLLRHQKLDGSNHRTHWYSLALVPLLIRVGRNATLELRLLEEPVGH